MNEIWMSVFFHHVNCRKVLLSLLQLMGFHDQHGNGYLFQLLISTDFTEVRWRAREWHCSVWSSKKTTCHSEPSHGWDLSRSVTTHVWSFVFNSMFWGNDFCICVLVWVIPQTQFLNIGNAGNAQLAEVIAIRHQWSCFGKGESFRRWLDGWCNEVLGWKCWEYLVELIISIDDDIHWHICI